MLSPWTAAFGGLKQDALPWPHVRLPELLWIAALVRELGATNASQIVAPIAIEAVSLDQSNQPLAPQTSTFYYNLDGDVRDRIVQRLKDERVYAEFCRGINKLLRVLPWHPIATLVENVDERSSSDESVDYLEDLFISYCSRLDHMAVVLQAIVVHSHACAGRLFIGNGIEGGDLTPLFDGTSVLFERYQRAAAYVRTASNLILSLSLELASLAFSDEFWSKVFMLRPCVPVRNPYLVDVYAHQSI